VSLRCFWNSLLHRLLQSLHRQLHLQSKRVIPIPGTWWETRYLCQYFYDFFFRRERENCGQVLRMLDSQSEILRKAVISQSILRSRWKNSREKLLICPETGEENAITLGEAHILIELQVANQVWCALECACIRWFVDIMHLNQNLKAQLRHSNALLAEKNEELQRCQLQCLKLQKQMEILATPP
jgi:hypothetical protein